MSVGHALVHPRLTRQFDGLLDLRVTIERPSGRGVNAKWVVEDSLVPCHRELEEARQEVGRDGDQAVAVWRLWFRKPLALAPGWRIVTPKKERLYVLAADTEDPLAPLAEVLAEQRSG